MLVRRAISSATSNQHAPRRPTFPRFFSSALSLPANPLSLGSSSTREAQSCLPVLITMCLEYRGIVPRSGVVRSMSRSGGSQAQGGKVGGGHCGVCGMGTGERGTMGTGMRRRAKVRVEM